MAAAQQRNWRAIGPIELPPILAAAVEAFHEAGYHGAYVREIVERADVSVPTLYYHYGSKQGLLVTLLETAMRALLEHAEQAIAEAGADPERQFAHLCEATVLYVTRRVAIAALDSEMRYLEPANRRSYAALRKQLENLFVAVVQDGIDAGIFQLGNPELTVRALLGMFQSVTAWYHPGGPRSATAVAEHYTAIAFRTVGAVRPFPS